AADEGQRLHDLREAHDGPAGEVVAQFHARLGHPPSAEPFAFNCGIRAPERPDQVRAVDVAGRFAGAEEDAGHGCSRMNWTTCWATCRALSPSSPATRGRFRSRTQCTNEANSSFRGSSRWTVRGSTWMRSMGDPP